MVKANEPQLLRRKMSRPIYLSRNYREHDRWSHHASEAIGCSALFAEISRVVFASAAAALIKRTAIDRVAVAYMESCEWKQQS